MLDTVPLLVSIPASGTRTVQVPLSNPAMFAELGVNVSYIGGTGTAATYNITLSGTGGVGQNLSGVIAGNAYTYLGVSGDTTTTIAATNLTTYLKTQPGIVGFFTITSSTNVVTLTAVNAGTSFNTLGVTCVGSGTLTAAVAVGATGTNNVVSGTTGVTATFMISYNNGVSYVATNMSGFTVPGSVTLTGENFYSRVYYQNAPFRIDSATVTNVQIALTNLDATYPAVVAVQIETEGGRVQV